MALFTLIFAVPALAADAPADTIVVNGGRGPDPLGSTASITSLPIDAGLPASTDLAALVDRAPGTRVLRLGGLGDWSAVSIRGSSLRSVTVAIDGIPLNPDGAEAVNLAELPLSGFSRVDVWRGNAPIAFGTGPMGGVIDLITRSPATSVSVAGGSHLSTRLAAIGGRTSANGVRSLIVADAFATRGDFRYFDDGSTLYDPHDDAILHRVNNDKTQMTGLARLYRAGTIDWTGLATGLIRDEGLPGPSGAPTVTARLGTTRALVAIAAHAGDDDRSATVRAWGLGRRETLDDRDGEIGVSAQWDDAIAGSTGVHFDGIAIPAVGTTLRLSAEARGDAVKTVSRLDGTTSGTDRRGAVVAAIAADQGLGPIVVSPAVQAGAWTAAGGDGKVPIASVDPRLGVRWTVDPTVTVKANAGRYLRPPDTTELFGDRGAMVGNPDLRPERGLSADLGAAWQPDDAVSVEASGFAVRASDLIAWSQNGQATFVAKNLGRADVYGIEFGGTAQIAAWFDVRASATRTWSINRSENPAYAGNALPRSPAWDVDSAVSAHRGAFRASWTLSATAGNYWDATNWYATPARVLHGASIGVAIPGKNAPDVSLDVMDVGGRLSADAPANPLDPRSPDVPSAITDFGGFPLAGRTAMVNVRWGPR